MPPHIFRIATVGKKLHGASEAWTVTVPAIAKPDVMIPKVIANEYVAAGIARILGIPVAPGGVVQMSQVPKTLAYAVLQFHAGHQLPNAIPSSVVRTMPRESAGLVAFDILIANPDRHTGNISGLFREKPPQMFVFDHSHALLGYDDRFSVQRLNSLRGRLGISGGTVTQQNRHCLIDELTDPLCFAEWTARIRSIPDFFIKDLCSEMESRGFITVGESLALRDFLLERRANISKIIYDNRDEFKGMNQLLMPW
jgi:hypothetical protein